MIVIWQYLFQIHAQTWDFKAQAVGDDNFGWSIALSGDTSIITSMTFDNSTSYGTGVAYVYQWDGTHWLKQTTLAPSDGASGNSFGHSVALDGNVAVVGAPFDIGEASDESLLRGAAYIFARIGMTWESQSKIFASDSIRFGHSVAVSGDTVLVGAPNTAVTAPSSGAAYIFARSVDATLTWVQQAKLFPADGSDYNEFGMDVAL